MRLVPAALAALALAAPADAATFYVVSRTPQAWTLVDPATVEMTPGGVRRIASVTVQKSITPKGPPQPGYLRSVSEYDCAQRRTRWLRFTLYSSAGRTVMSQQNAQPAWTQPSRGTEGGAILALLCGDPGGHDQPVISAPSVGDLIVSLFASWN